MNTAKKVIWIDDNPGRARTASEFGAIFINVRNADLAKTVEDLLKDKQPKMVILDHILDKTTTTNPIFQRGSTIAGAIKEQWPTCPVIGVTNDDNVEEINSRTRLTYDRLFRYDNFGYYFQRIESIAKGFALIAKRSPSTTLELVALLKPPSDQTERLLAALPDTLKGATLDTSVASSFYRWVDHLMGRPGFLYDTLWAATLLGLNESGFAKVTAQFEKAKYAGSFAVNDDVRWWLSRLTDVLYRLCEPYPGEFSWHTGRRLEGMTKRFFSTCYVCGNEFPETVAYLDSESTERKAMHLACTVLHPRFQRELYFEDIRMMKGN